MTDRLETNQPVVDRCSICGWPLHEDTAKGCTIANCSMRPWPTRYADPARARREYGDRLPREVDPYVPPASDAIIAELRAEIDTLHQRLQTAEQKAKRATDALARMNLVDDDMGIYMAGTHNPDGTFTPRTEFGDGWNAAVSQYGKALLQETFEMMDEGLVADLADEAGEEGYGPLVAFLRRAKKAEAERDAAIQRADVAEAAWKMATTHGCEVECNGLVHGMRLERDAALQRLATMEAERDRSVTP